MIRIKISHILLALMIYMIYNNISNWGYVLVVLAIAILSEE